MQQRLATQPFSFDPCITETNLFDGPYASEGSVNIANWDLQFYLYDSSIGRKKQYDVQFNMNLSFNYFPDGEAYRDLTALATDQALKDAYDAAYGTVYYGLDHITNLGPYQMQLEIRRIFTSAFQYHITQQLPTLDPTIDPNSLNVGNILDPDADSFDPDDCLYW